MNAQEREENNSQSFVMSVWNDTCPLITSVISSIGQVLIRNNPWFLKICYNRFCQLVRRPLPPCHVLDALKTPRFNNSFHLSNLHRLINFKRHPSFFWLNKMSYPSSLIWNVTIRTTLFISISGPSLISKITYLSFLLEKCKDEPWEKWKRKRERERCGRHCTLKP